MTAPTKEQLVERYLEYRDEIDAIEAEAKERTKPMRAWMDKIEAYFLALSEAEGMKNYPTNAGLVYFSDADSATLADPESFMEYVVANNAWDLLQKRVTTTAVRAFIEEHGIVPPGVNFASRKKVIVRRGK